MRFLTIRKLLVLITIGICTFYSNTHLFAQLRIDDISPKIDGTTITQPDWYQSVSGKGLCIAMSADGQRVYLGGHSGVWRSDDGGANWTHLERPQPTGGLVYVGGALLSPNVYDLLVSPTNKDIVFAATGRDARVPSQSGIYRSVDGGNLWTRVHQFINGTSTGITSRIVAAPDSPNIIYVAGQYAVAKSNDGGDTWTETRPQGTSGLNVWSIAVGRQQGTGRKIYAIGGGVWYSIDDGASWARETAAQSLGLTVGPPADGAGFSSKTLTINPSNPNIIYINSGGNIWKGDFTSVTTSGSGTAAWTQLPSTPIGFDGTTASGTDYIVAHNNPAGQLYLLASDRRTTHISIGEPASATSWIRIDRPNVHIDPHGIDLTAQFRYSESGSGAHGRIVMVNDGGAYFSTTSGATWQQGKGLSTLGLVNSAIMPNPGGKPSICIGTGDNSGFFSKDGGVTWKTQDYLGGDNDACFADPLQPNHLIVFAPRSGNKGIFLYRAPIGQIPDGAMGTSQRVSIPAPPPLPNDERGWNVVSSYYNLGYRPLIYTLSGQQPQPNGDFITLRFTETQSILLRTKMLGSVDSPSDWVNVSADEEPGVKVFQEGPELPAGVGVVQASGGHESPVYYAGDPNGLQRLWKWTKGMNQWQQLIPGPITNGTPLPSIARRFFVDPYRPNVIYIVDRNNVRRSDDGGSKWVLDTRLQNALTENSAFPIAIPDDGNPGEALLRDLIFDPIYPEYRFAIGPAGVFYTLDGANWHHFILTSAMPMRPNNATYDPCERALYVATNNRGILRFSPLPPDWEGKIGGLYAAEGKISMLRVQDVGTKYGHPSDQLDVEVVVKLDSWGEKAFGFQLRKDGNGLARKGMLTQLREAFRTNTTIKIDYSRSGCNTGEIIRVMKL